MSISFNPQIIFRFVRVNTIEAAPQPETRTAPTEVIGRPDYLEARTRLSRAFKALQELADLTGVQTRFRLDLPDAQSTAGLGLDLTETAAALGSVDEINASPHSFSPFGPDWTGASSALLTLGGEYDGSNGTGTLSFESRRNGTHGQDNLRIRVRDPLGGVLANLNIQASHPLDREYALGNGLFVTLGAGDLVRRDTASMQVFQNVGSAVNPNLPLGGVRNENPNFQYYPAPNTLAPIVDGTFLINGESIDVTAGGTLNDVVDAINLSAAGVTATFNASIERVEIVQNTAGSAPTIDLSGDTSGFLVSAKLDTAVVTPGTDPETKKLMTDVVPFSGVGSGDFLINGTPIGIDPAADSLFDVIDRINASGAQVSASFDDVSQRVLIEANESASEFDIDSNGTGLFAALNMPEGRVDPIAAESGFSRRRSYEIADTLESILSDFNYLFRDASFAESRLNKGIFRAALEATTRDLFGNGDRPPALYGIQFDHSAEARQRGDFATLDRRTFTRSLQLRGDDVKHAFNSSDDRVGIIEGLANAVQQALANVNSVLGKSGSTIDLFA